eukprot:scaffold579477_cov20-Prasinocladus_malaysianus.AAC.1
MVVGRRSETPGSQQLCPAPCQASWLTQSLVGPEAGAALPLLDRLPTGLFAVCSRLADTAADGCKCVLCMG